MQDFTKQPFFIVCFLEFFERFGYYGFIYISIFFYMHKLNFSESQATILMGGFSAFTYAFNAFGGMIADRILGIKRAMFTGAAILALGYLLLAFSVLHVLVYLALSFIIIGSCLFKPAPTNLIAQSYMGNSKELDVVFTYFYMSINMGSFIASMLIPYLTKNFGYMVAMILCSFGLLLGICYNILNYKVIKPIDNLVGHSKLNVRRIIQFILGLIVVIGLISILLQYDNLINWMLAIAATMVFSYFIFEIVKSKDKISRQKMQVALILLIYAVIFFVIYQQKNTSFMLFNVHHVNLLFWGIQINPQTVPGVLNTSGIILLSPFIAFLYRKLGERDLALPQKFALGLTLSSSAYGLLYLVCLFTNPEEKINFVWEIFAISFLFSSAELLISALGVSLMAQLVPERLRGFSMGMWFVATALGIKLGSYLASLAAYHSLKSAMDPVLVGADKVASFRLYQELFGTVFVCGLIVSVIAWIIGRHLTRMLQSVVVKVS